MITIIFEDNIDFYFARQRVTEKLSQANTFLPAGVVPYLAPDATALGPDLLVHRRSRARASDRFRAAVGAQQVLHRAATQRRAGRGRRGHRRRHAAGISDRCAARRRCGPTASRWANCMRPSRKSNMPAGGGVIQKNNAEYIVRGVGWIKDKGDIENTVIKEVNGTPIYVKTVATVQLGTQFRRSVFEKDGNEVTGGVVLMRHGENPLAVTERVKEKIQELQPGLPEGVHIVPAYDRTRLIHGAIHTLTEVMWHEMVIASLAILLILMHVRSVFVICVTLPLSVLFSFLMMWILRRLGIIDIQANIMSLAGHHDLDRHPGRSGDRDDRERHASPQGAFRRQEGHRRHSRAGDRAVPHGRPADLLLRADHAAVVHAGVHAQRPRRQAVPSAGVHQELRHDRRGADLGHGGAGADSRRSFEGRLRSEEENWIVRSFINIYKPLLTWALPRRNLVMWVFAVLLILAAGMFPLQAVVGQGASETAWQTAFLLVFAVVTSLTVISTRGWQLASAVAGHA